MTRESREMRGPRWMDPIQTWCPTQTHRANRSVS
jgi:hypothetical protein